MMKIILRRIFSSLITLIALISVLFFIFKLLPGGPFDSEVALSPQTKQALEAQFYLDKPASTQFLHYLHNLMHADLGPSLEGFGSRTVYEIMSEALPLSLALGFSAFFLAFILGVALSGLSILYQRRWPEKLITFIANLGIAMPNYVFASLLIFIFAIRFEVFPVALYEGPYSLVLPCIALSFRPFSLIYKSSLASFRETINENYIRTAIGKGMSRQQAVFKHALKNALSPILSVSNQIFSNLLVGSFVIETMFALPGLGRYFVSSIINRDYPLSLGILILYGLLIIISNLVSDVLLMTVDPRIKDEIF